MAKQHINTGVTADDGTGDTLRQAGVKINSNFDELYAALASAQSINTIEAGDGIEVSNNAGVVTITNTATLTSVPANSLTGSTLASNVTGSSLTSVGTLIGLTVTNPIIGSITGSAPALSLSGTTLNPSVVTSSLTTVGQLTSLNVNTNLQKAQLNTFCPPTVNTVVYAASGEFRHALRLFVIVEGREDGGGPNWETQAADIIAVKGYNSNGITVSAFGITYSGLAALAVFDGVWNATENRIEIVCTPVSMTNSVTVTVHALELQSND